MLKPISVISTMKNNVTSQSDYTTCLQLNLQKSSQPCMCAECHCATVTVESCLAVLSKVCPSLYQYDNVPTPIPYIDLML